MGDILCCCVVLFILSQSCCQQRTTSYVSGVMRLFLLLSCGAEQVWLPGLSEGRIMRGIALLVAPSVDHKSAPVSPGELDEVSPGRACKCYFPSPSQQNLQSQWQQRKLHLHRRHHLHHIRSLIMSY